MSRCLLILILVALLACDVTPEWPAHVEQWSRYADENTGIAFDYPASWTVEL